MKKTALVIMAAGIGSRFGGGIKQLEPVGPNGEIIMDYSIHDALEAGFDRIIFVIRHDLEEDFKEVIGNRIEKIAPVTYAFQELSDVPEGFSVPADRKKPWGTGQAVRCCKGVVNEPFAVINADDYYGVHAFQEIYDFLSTHQDDDKYRYTMVAYKVENTLTENGHVARGVCTTDEQNHLVAIHERTHIEKRGDQTEYTEDDGQTWTVIPEGSLVSMNMWGFTPEILDYLDQDFAAFLSAQKEGDLKCEYLIPTVVDDMLKKQLADVQVLETRDRWFGVTYAEDKAYVTDSIQALVKGGIYPEKLFQ